MVNQRFNPLTRLFYRVFWYFETGKNSIARFYQPLIDALALVAFTKIIFGSTLSNTQLGILLFSCIVVITVWGYFYKKSGLFDTDVFVKADKDPVQKEIFEAALLIKQREGRN